MVVACLGPPDSVRPAGGRPTGRGPDVIPRPSPTRVSTSARKPTTRKSSRPFKVGSTVSGSPRRPHLWVRPQNNPVRQDSTYLLRVHRSRGRPPGSGPHPPPNLGTRPPLKTPSSLCLRPTAEALVTLLVPRVGGRQSGPGSESNSNDSSTPAPRPAEAWRCGAEREVPVPTGP